MVAFAIKTPPQHGTWPEFLEVWKAADDIDLFESAWTMDHFYPLTPPMDGTHLESWTMLAALAALTTPAEARLHGERHALPASRGDGERRGDGRSHLRGPVQPRPRRRLVRTRVERLRHPASAR